MLSILVETCKINSMKSVYESLNNYLINKPIPQHLRIAQGLALVATTASTAEDLSNVLSVICEQAALILESPITLIRLYNPLNDQLELAGSYGIGNDHLEKFFTIPHSPLYNLTNPEAPHLIITKLDQVPPTPADNLPIRNQLETLVIANMILRGEFLGVFVIFLPKGRTEVNEEERLFLEALVEQASISAERFSLAKSQEKRIQEMEEFVHLSNDLRNVHTKAEIVSILLWDTQKLFQADRGAAFLISDQKVSLQCCFGYGDELELEATSQECPYLSSLKSGTTIFIKDLQQHPQLLQQNCFQKPLQDVCSAILIPLCFPNQLIGYILLAYLRMQKFDVPLLSNFHFFQEIVDSNLERLQILENLEQMVLNRTRDIRALYEITTILNTPLSFAQAIIQVLNRTVELMNTQASTIHSCDEKNKQIKLMCQVGLSTKLEEELRDNSLFQAIIQEVILQDAPLFFENLTDKLPQSSIATMDQPVSYLGIPIRARGKHLGVLSVLGLPNPFTLNEQNILIAISDHLGLAIERYRLSIQAAEAAKLAERQRLAQELHDSLTQSLYSITLLSKAYQSALPYSKQDEILAWLKEFNSISQEAMKELRLLLYELRPTALEQDGLYEAIQHRIDAVEKRAGIETHLETNGRFRLSAEEEEAIYRIIQEALNNALQHAHHHRIDIYLQFARNSFKIQIQDDGIGFDPKAVEKQAPGMGLINMTERAKQIGAKLKIISTPSQGTTILLTRENHDE